MVHAIAEEFNTKTLPEIQSLARRKTGAETCFEIWVTAGMTTCSSADTIEQIIEKAEVNHEIIAKYQCDKEDGSL